jgi:hypothetical protein
MINMSGTNIWSEFHHWEMWNVCNALALWLVRFLRHFIVMTHCLRRADVEEPLLHCTPQQQRAPFGNRSCSADLQSSLALVNHLGTTDILQTLESLCLCLFWGSLLYYRHRTAFCKCQNWKSLLYWRLHEQFSASASFGKHSLEILEVKKMYCHF